MNLVNRVLRSENIKNTFIIAVGGFVGSFFSYLLLFFLGRQLSITEYGLYSTLISLSSLIVIPTAVIGVSVVKRTSELVTSKEWDRYYGFFGSLIFFMMLLSAVVFGLIYFSKGYLEHKFQIQDKSVILAFSLLTALSFPSGIFGSSLQGLMRYTKFAFYSITSSLLRMGFALIPAFLGLGIVGIFNGISLALILSFVIALVLINVSFRRANPQHLKEDYRKLFLFSIPAAILAISQTFMINIDLVLVRRFFDPLTTGYYAGAITLGKILLFGCTAVATVMYPQIISARSQGKNTSRLFKQFLVLQVALVLAGLSGYLLFPHLISTLFFGSTFSASVPYVRFYAIFASLFVTMNFLALYLLAIEKTKIFLVFLPTIGIQYLYILINHESLYSVLFGNSISVCIAIFSMVAYLVRVYPRFLLNLFHPSHQSK
jgi:O-antigen/teichoic acid export membrane protein